MRLRLLLLFWLPPDWLEAGLAIFAVFIGGAILLSGATYHTAAIWAPVADWLPHWALAAWIAGAGAVWGGALLARRRRGRAAACFAALGFWVFITWLWAVGGASPVGVGLWAGHAATHGLIWWRLRAEGERAGRPPDEHPHA